MKRKKKKEEYEPIPVMELSDQTRKFLNYNMARALLKAQVRKGNLAESCFQKIDAKIDQILDNNLIV